MMASLSSLRDLAQPASSTRAQKPARIDHAGTTDLPDEDKNADNKPLNQEGEFFVQSSELSETGRTIPQADMRDGGSARNDMGLVTA
jgi:hypothetical protein